MLKSTNIKKAVDAILADKNIELNACKVEELECLTEIVKSTTAEELLEVKLGDEKFFDYHAKRYTFEEVFIIKEDEVTVNMDNFFAETYFNKLREFLELNVISATFNQFAVQKCFVFTSNGISAVDNIYDEEMVAIINDGLPRVLLNVKLPLEVSDALPGGFNVRKLSMVKSIIAKLDSDIAIYDTSDIKEVVKEQFDGPTLLSRISVLATEEVGDKDELFEWFNNIELTRYKISFIASGVSIDVLGSEASEDYLTISQYPVPTIAVEITAPSKIPLKDKKDVAKFFYNYRLTANPVFKDVDSEEVFGIPDEELAGDVIIKMLMHSFLFADIPLMQFGGIRVRQWLNNGLFLDPLSYQTDKTIIHSGLETMTKVGGDLHELQKAYVPIFEMDEFNQYVAELTEDEIDVVKILMTHDAHISAIYPLVYNIPIHTGKYEDVLEHFMKTVHCCLVDLSVLDLPYYKLLNPFSDKLTARVLDICQGDITAKLVSQKYAIVEVDENNEIVDFITKIDEED